MRVKELVLTILPPIVWIGMIYFASSQPYEQQDLRPILGEMDLSFVERWFSWVSFTYSNTVISIENRGVTGFVEFFLRKGAHVFVFFVLGFLIFRVLKLFKIKAVPQFFLTLLFIIAFASIDEFRHFHHPNRTGLIEDVILDTVGGLLGISTALFLQKIRER
ncbi:VanZ family protein [Anaerobacillus alkaliphilus]|uniref:VanZ family protein n=1 Tax=Anaerobacillus alkaliphilus TaxID=1548597 RepID=A0A4Q0VVJ9_9BACI|nr:VanZ family protein [Anaerobacillus alkaliphilus]RXJ02941.1 VanZ family protein [Anaerobacillus alkaliphilus]